MKKYLRISQNIIINVILAIMQQHTYYKLYYIIPIQLSFCVIQNELNRQFKSQRIMKFEKVVVSNDRWNSVII